MLEAPALSLERLTACLDREYGLAATSVVFLPLGADVDTAVYRVESCEGIPFFLKLRRNFQPASVVVPYLLAKQGIRNVIAPRATRAGELFVKFDDWFLLLSPFVAGVSGWDVELTPGQWRELGRGLRALHTVELPETMACGVLHETYNAGTRLQVRALLDEMQHSQTNDAISRELLRLAQEKRTVIVSLLRHADELSALLRQQPPRHCLCHGDMHAGNILLADDRLFIVDWDTLVMAPPERDLMFIGGSVGGCWNKPQEVQWFMQGYGPQSMDETALAYYRCERILQDIAEFAQALLIDSHSEADRREMLQQFASQFDEGNVVEIALATVDLV